MNDTPSPLGRRQLLQGIVGLLAAAAAGRGQAAAPIIRLAINTHFRPYSFCDEEGALRGLLIDEIRLAADGAGLAVDFVDRPWARGQQMVRSGELDALCTIPTKERRSYVLFAPTPLFHEDVVLVGRADNPRLWQARTLEDLKRLKIAQPFGTGWLRGYLSDDQIIWSPYVSNILSMIEAGRVDATIYGRAAIEAAIAASPYAAVLHVAAFPALPHDEGFCFGLRKSFPDAERLIDQIDQSLSHLSAKGGFDPIRERYLAPG